MSNAVEGDLEGSSSPLAGKRGWALTDDADAADYEYRPLRIESHVSRSAAAARSCSAG